MVRFLKLSEHSSKRIYDDYDFFFFQEFYSGKLVLINDGIITFVLKPGLLPCYRVIAADEGNMFTDHELMEIVMTFLREKHLFSEKKKIKRQSQRLTRPNYSD